MNFFLTQEIVSLGTAEYIYSLWETDMVIKKETAEFGY